jgi:hypothetical protein
MPYNEQEFSIPEKVLDSIRKNAWFHSKKCLIPFQKKCLIPFQKNAYSIPKNAWYFFKFNERDIDHHPKWFGAREHETENLWVKIDSVWKFLLARHNVEQKK